jgi:tRNA threonylcarbamoyladenosine biosynthesis protein TsaE
MSDSHLELRLVDSSATEALGAALARAYIARGRGSAAMYFEGELGAGKTTCVRSLLRTLGVTGLIRSPTYTLVEVYALGGVTCVHVDLYRLQDVGEVAELGLRDYLDGDCLLLVEWPDKGRAVLPPADLEFVLQYQDLSRACRLDASSARGQGWLADLVNDTSLAPYVFNLT